MPELPEVETVRLGLKRLLPGLKILRVSSDWSKSFPNVQPDIDAFLIGSYVKDVRRRAKVLIIDLSTNYSLLIHLKMTGQLVFVAQNQRFGAGHPNESLVGSLPDKSTRVIFELDDGATLYFNDQRKFGWVRLLPTIEIPEIDFFKKVGPEPLEATFSAEKFIIRLMRRKNSGIKAVILDQTVIAGVGNIYADESLFAAKIHPASIVAAIPKSKLVTLFHELQAVLRLSIEKGGSSDRNYVNAEGKKGSYISFAKVFRREKQSCYECGTIIIKTRVAGRGTHTCPVCQVLED